MGTLKQTPFEGIPLLVSDCAGSFPNMWPGGVTVTQENYWNSSGHFSAHDPRQEGEKKKPKHREVGRSVMSVPCEAPAGSEMQRQQRKGGLVKNRQFWSSGKRCGLFGQIHRHYQEFSFLTGLKECMLVCVVRISTTRQSSVKSFESGWWQISAPVRPAATVVVQRLLSILLNFLQLFTDSFWLLPDI